MSFVKFGTIDMFDSDTCMTLLERGNHAGISISGTNIERRCRGLSSQLSLLTDVHRVRESGTIGARFDTPQMKVRQRLEHVP